MPAYRDQKKLTALKKWLERPHTVEEVMARWKISQRTAYHWIDAVGGERVRRDGQKGFAFQVQL